MKYVFIVNPIAGNDDKAKIFSRIKSTFRGIDDEMIMEETTAQGDAMRISKRYAEEYGNDCIIVSCGGDGTVHEICNGLAGTDTPMMILPLGTGNDFAKKVYNTKNINVENVIKSFGFYNGKLKYDIMPIDLIDYNGEKGINVMSFGVDTVVETIGKKIADKASFLGHNAYNIAIIPAMTKPLHYKISYELNCIDVQTGEEYIVSEHDKDYALMAICNASYYGGGFCPAPNSKLDDGILDGCIINGISILKAPPLIVKYSNGTLNSETSDECTNLYIKSGRIYTEVGSDLLGNCDGENFHYNDLTFNIVPKALKLCVIKD